jgi:hypothetical protein
VVYLQLRRVEKMLASQLLSKGAVLTVHALHSVANSRGNINIVCVLAHKSHRHAVYL